jgi:hypothetical protein
VTKIAPNTIKNSGHQRSNQSDLLDELIARSS